MSFHDNGNAALPSNLDPESYSFEHPAPPMSLSQSWGYGSMAPHIPSYPAQISFLPSLEEGSESNDNISGVPFQHDQNQDPFSSGFNLSTLFNTEEYDQLQVPQHQQLYHSSSPSPYQHYSSTPAINRLRMAHSPMNSTVTSLSLNSSPSPSPSSPELQPQAQLSSSSIPVQPTPAPSPYIVATMEGTEESRRRGRRREQNRKAQFIFRQKRKDEVQRLQLEVMQLKQQLATVQEDAKWRQVATTVTGCGAGADGGMVLCALCKGYVAQCQ